MTTTPELSSQSSATKKLFAKPFLRSLDFNILLLLAWPLILLCINNYWIQRQVAMVDPWIYFAYFLNLKNYLSIFPAVYYGTRLPWLIPGFLSQKFFSPIIGTYVLHFALYYLSVFSLYQISKRFFNRRTGLFITLFMGSHPFFLQSIGWDYYDSAGITYFFLTLLSLTYPKPNPSRSFFSGFFFGCMIHTHLFLIVYTPILIILLLRAHAKSLKAYTRNALLGFSVLTISLCIINHLIFKRPYLFFRPAFKISKTLLKFNEWCLPFSSWPKLAHLIIPASVCIASIVFLLVKRRKKIADIPETNTSLFCSLSILTFFTYLFFQFVLKQPMMQLEFYTSYMIPITFLTLGSLLAQTFKNLNKSHSAALLAFIAIELVLLNSKIPHFTTLLFCFLTYIGISLIFSKKLNFKSSATTLFICALPWINLPFFYSNTKYQFCAAEGTLSKEETLSLVHSFKKITELDPKLSSRIWFDSHSEYGKLQACIAACFLWGHRLINSDFPQTHPSDIHSHSPVVNDQIFILSENPAAFELANQNLQEINLCAKLLHEIPVNSNLVSYKILHIQICNRASNDS